MDNASLKQVVCFGEILWDVLPGGAKPGGAPMNVAYHLKKLGLQPTIITRVGEDEYGTRLIELMRQHGIATTYFQTDPVHSTGMVYAEPNENHEVTYDIVYPAAWDFITKDEATEHALQSADYFIYGSLITRGEQSKSTLFQLLELAKTKVLDINLRPPFFNQTLIEQLMQQVDILKLNESELALIAGWYNDAADIKEQLRFLQDKFQVPTVIVTRGGDGAILNLNGALYEHPGYKVQVADTVGSGDAFLAGMLYKLSQNTPPQQALNFASAIGALVASYSGAWPDYKVEEITALMR